jgi:hypothetical protein
VHTVGQTSRVTIDFSIAIDVESHRLQVAVGNLYRAEPVHTSHHVGEVIIPETGSSRGFGCVVATFMPFV